MQLIHTCLLVTLLASTSVASLAFAETKKVIESAAQLPQGAFTLDATPSALIFEDDEAFAAMAAELSASVASLLAEYDIKDASTRRGLLEVQRSIALVEQRWDDALALSPEIRALHDKPADQAWSGVLTDTLAVAAKEAGAASGEAFTQAFRRLYQARIESLDYTVVGDEIENLRGTASIITPTLLRGQVQGAMDPAAESQSNTVDRNFLASIVSTRFTLMLVETFPIVAEVLDARIQEMAKPKEDRWSPRLVNLNATEGLSPVVVGVWDSGLDVSLFEGRLWRNENEIANGKDDDGNGHIDDLHGISFDDEDNPTPLALRPMDDVRELDDLFDLLKGFLDLQAAIASPEAALLQQTIAKLPADEVTPFLLELGKAVLFMHGTSITDVAVADNPAARIVFGRFSYPIKAIPEPQTEEDVEAHVRRVDATVAYLAAAGARVINMSFGTGLAGIEAGLQQTVPDPKERREIAVERWSRFASAYEGAIKRYPEILFIAAAGNDDSDVDYAKSLPAGLNAPNLITVGAVDISLQPAGFTAFGESVDVYANGFEVPARVPGGRVIAASGTSQAAPAVANLAAKLWAIEPELTVAQVRSLIESTTTEEGPQKLKVVNPTAAIARVGQ